MADISLTDYTSQLAANARQQRMAELMQQQAMEPIQVMSAGGVPAPIPWTAVLAKALQSGAGVYASNRADKRAAKIKAAQDADIKRNVAELLNPTHFASGVRGTPELLARLRAMAEKVDPTPVRVAPFDTTGMVPTVGILAGAPKTSAAMAAALQQNAPSLQPQPATAPLVTALGGTPPPAPTAMPSPVAMPPTGNLALQGNGEGMTPRAIAALRAENMRNQGPITPMAEPLVGVEGQSKLDRPKTAAERQSEAVQAMLSGNAALAAVGSNFYERGAKREEKAYDAEQLNNQINAAGLDSKTTSMLRVIGQFGGGDAVSKALAESMKPPKDPNSVREYNYAQSQGYEGKYNEFLKEQRTPPFVSVSPGESLYATGGSMDGAPNVAPGQLSKFVTDNFPGAIITSGQRTPSQNAAVGGAPNSAHLDNRAQDFVFKLPNGAPDLQRMEETARQFNANAPPGVKMLYEGPGAKNSTAPHLHIQQTAASGGGQQLRPIIQGEAKPTGHQASDAEKAAFEYKPTDKVWINADGKPELIGGQKAPTDGQRRAATLTYRMLEGNNRLNNLAKEGIYGPSSPVSSLFKKSDTGLVTIALKTEQDRRYIQAIREFIAPILRYDSGAAVPDSEVLSYMETYGGKFEDSPKVKWQKAQGRTAQIRAMIGSTKDVYEDQYGEIPKIEVLTDPRGRPAGPAPRSIF